MHFVSTLLYFCTCNTSHEKILHIMPLPALDPPSFVNMVWLQITDCKDQIHYTWSVFIVTFQHSPPWETRLWVKFQIKLFQGKGPTITCMQILYTSVYREMSSVYVTRLSYLQKERSCFKNVIIINGSWIFSVSFFLSWKLRLSNSVLWSIPSKLSNIIFH